MQYSGAFTASSHGLRKHNTKLTSVAGILFKLIFSSLLRTMVDGKFVSLNKLVCQGRIKNSAHSNKLLRPHFWQLLRIELHIVQYKTRLLQNPEFSLFFPKSVRFSCI